jgi:hypothetical protein
MQYAEKEGRNHTFSMRAITRSLSESPTLNLLTLPKAHFKQEGKTGTRGRLPDLGIRSVSNCAGRRSDIAIIFLFVLEL